MVVGGIVHPEDGYVQPADLTQALAKGARNRGATIYRNTMVLAIEQATSGAWIIKPTRATSNVSTSSPQPVTTHVKPARWSVSISRDSG